METYRLLPLPETVVFPGVNTTMTVAPGQDRAVVDGGIAVVNTELGV